MSLCVSADFCSDYTHHQQTLVSPAIIATKHMNKLSLGNTTFFKYYIFIYIYIHRKEQKRNEFICSQFLGNGLCPLKHTYMRLLNRVHQILIKKENQTRVRWHGLRFSSFMVSEKKKMKVLRSAEERIMGHPLRVHMIGRLRFADKFLLFYSAVLKPNSNLTLRQISGGRDASSFVFGDEFAGCVLFFQFL